MPAGGGKQLANNRHRSKPGQKCQASSPRSVSRGVRHTTSRRTAQADPPPVRPNPVSAGTYYPAATASSEQGRQPADPLTCERPCSSSSSSRGVWRQTSGAGTAPAPTIAPPIHYRKCSRPDSFSRLFSPTIWRHFRLASCSSARWEARSRERARSVSEAGARLVDDNKFVGQCGSPPRLSRQPSGSRTYFLRTDGGLRKLPVWGARFRSAPSPRPA